MHQHDRAAGGDDAGDFGDGLARKWRTLDDHLADATISQRNTVGPADDQIRDRLAARGSQCLVPAAIKVQGPRMPPLAPDV